MGGGGGDEYSFKDVGSFPGVPVFSGVGKKYRGVGVKRFKRNLSMSGLVLFICLFIYLFIYLFVVFYLFICFVVVFLVIGLDLFVI